MLTGFFSIFVENAERRQAMAYRNKSDAFEYIKQYQKEHYDRITVMAEKGKKKEYRLAAELKGMTLSAFVQDCVEKELSRMKE